MKTGFFLCFALLCICATTDAQVCKISNSNDNVEVFSAYVVDGSRVEVTVGNDSQNISANVTVEVEVTYNGGGGNYRKMTYSGKEIAKPNGTTVIKIPISQTYKGESRYKAESVKVLGITGTKCL